MFRKLADEALASLFLLSRLPPNFLSRHIIPVTFSVLKPASPATFHVLIKPKTSTFLLFGFCTSMGREGCSRAYLEVKGR